MSESRLRAERLLLVLVVSFQAQRCCSLAFCQEAAEGFLMQAVCRPARILHSPAYFGFLSQAQMAIASSGHDPKTKQGPGSYREGSPGTKLLPFCFACQMPEGWKCRHCKVFSMPTYKAGQKGLLDLKLVLALLSTVG